MIENKDYTFSLDEVKKYITANTVDQKWKDRVLLFEFNKKQEICNR
ncbi:hypothetical protein ACJ2A9_23290 [Anaerobacillus sp. MEB173]